MADTDQVLKLAAIIREVNGDNSKGAAALAELILDHPSFCECHQPTPPADGEVAELVAEARYLVRELRDQADHLSLSLELFGLLHQAAASLNRAAELLQRQAQLEAAAKPRKCLIEPPSWCDDGQAHAWQAGWEARDEMLLQPWPPVSVSERLLGPEDCDNQGRCWCFAPQENIESSLVFHARWILSKPTSCDTHWLPAHALPLPEVGE